MRKCINQSYNIAKWYKNITVRYEYNIFMNAPILSELNVYHREDTPSERRNNFRVAVIVVIIVIILLIVFSL